MPHDARRHWENVYRTKEPAEVSWFQAESRLSLELIQRVAPDRETPIIDVGGGASRLVDGLLDRDYQDVTVLDLAASALALTRGRLAARAGLVTWMTGDVLETRLSPSYYGIWHDRAVFHFLTGAAERARYVERVRRSLRRGGHALVATFGPGGPTRCSGLDVMRYSPDTMHAEFGDGFRLIGSVSEDHRTPSGSVQEFVYCVCRFEPQASGDRFAAARAGATGPSAPRA